MKAAAFLVVIPAFFIGCLLGTVLFGVLPGLVITLLWHGGGAHEHPEIVASMMRPAAVLGGCIAAAASASWAAGL